MGSETTPHGGKESPHPRGARPGAELDARIAGLVARQYGVVSGEQLRRLGVGRRALEARLRARRLFRVHQGVYAVGHPALTREGRELAAVLACGPDALLSHTSAGGRWGLLRSSSPRIEVTAPRARHPRDGFVLHRSRSVEPEDRAELDGIPVTSVARTLVDLADVLDERRLGDAINEAETLRLFDLGAIQDTLNRLHGRRGTKRLRRVLIAYQPEPRFTRSEMERRFLRLCREYGLPMPEANAWLGGQEVDAYWSDARLAVELDSRAFHATRRAFEEDRRRDRRLAAFDIQVTRVTWLDLEDGAALAAELADLRASRLRRAA